MDIKTYSNVLNKEEQSSILKLVNARLTTIPNCPGLQTYPELHYCEELQPLIKKLKKYIPGDFTIDKCWANHTDGGFINWDAHELDLSVVYYLKNKESLGTLFRIEDKIITKEGPENSLILFKKELHSLPPRKNGAAKIDRYSIAFEISTNNVEEVFV